MPIQSEMNPTTGHPTFTLDRSAAAEYGVEDLVDSLERYLNAGIPEGGFMTSVLANDLSGAFGRADALNTLRLRKIVQYIYNYFPSSKWGSYEKIEQHLKLFQEARHD